VRTDLEEDFDHLFDEKAISKARGAAEEKYKDHSSTDLEYLRKLCKTDLFFLANGPLEYVDLSPRLHGHLTHWIKSQWGSQYRMLLMARGHYKSTVCTVADGIQMALPNIANVQAMPYSYGPNLKLLIGHEVRETASKFLFEIAAAFTRKPGLMALFPECIPTRRTHRMNKWELELPRTQQHREATFSTIGAGGAAQGNHFHWLKLDDLVGEDARDSPTVMKKTLTWFDNVNSLLTKLALDGWDLIGTRWAYNDVYSHAMERYGIDIDSSVLSCVSERDIEKCGQGLLKVYARGAIEDGVPVFPEVFPLDTLAVLRKNRLVWAAQYANNPMESGMNEFIWPSKTYNVDAQGNIVVFTGDSSFKRYRHDLSIYILTDPSMGETLEADETGICVVGIDDRSNIFLLETIKKRLLPPEYVEELFRLHLKYRPQVIAIEEVNFSAIYKYWIEEKALRTKIYPPIRPYKPGSKKNKEGRIRGLSHFFSAGQFYIAEGMHDFQDEYDQFPMGKSKHLLDALAQGPEFWSGDLSPKSVESQANAVEQEHTERSRDTGY